MSLRDPLAVARGLGAARGGTGHWWLLRLTSIALMVLTPWFLLLVIGMRDAERYVIQMTLSRTLNATLIVIWVLSVFWHAQLGLQVVIEDYVHGRAEWALQILVRFLCVVGAIAALLAVVRIVLGA